MYDSKKHFSTLVREILPDAQVLQNGKIFTRGVVKDFLSVKLFGQFASAAFDLPDTEAEVIKFSQVLLDDIKRQVQGYINRKAVKEETS